ncbi:MAG: hypothetical protein H8E14_03280 [Candidatus Marinimicrobia bacterium]|nr:hypothetical protein [Candidatus Neomarinimicrobiota bacterium]
MKYPEGELLIKIKDQDQTAGELGLKSLEKLTQVDVYQHLNKLSVLFEDLGVPFDELHTFYDDLAQGLKEEYDRLTPDPDYPVMTLSQYDRWFRDILEATHIAHTNYHEQQLANLQALETSSAAFVKKIYSTEA